MIRRMPHPSNDRLAWAQLGAYLLIVVVVVVGFFKFQKLAEQDTHTLETLCSATNANREYIRLSILRNLKTLPTISYYQHHPKELAAAIDQTNQSLRDLPPDPCG